MAQSSQDTVTLIVHGTFAAESRWWRLGSGDSFADRLDRALELRGLSGSVWRPALARGLDYDDIGWSGRNRHADRKRGARDLAETVNRLAERVQATAERPLILNLVAHSHGGNVVLEALRHLNDKVTVGGMVLLGTPLMSLRPAFRAGRFLFANLLLAIAFIFLLFVVMQVGHVAVTCLSDAVGAGLECGFFEDAEAIERGEEYTAEVTTLMILPILVMFGWLFWLFAYLGDVAWYLLCKPFVWLFGRGEGPVYGPGAKALHDRLNGRRILLLTSHHDEAELLLQLGAAPGKLYRDYINSRLGSIGRFFEWILLRPIIDGLMLRAAEIVIERFAFGVPWRMVFCFDYEIADAVDGKAYPRSLFDEVRLTDDVLSSPPAMVPPAPEDVAEGDASLQAVEPLAEEAPSLHAALRTMAADIMAQIRLRHSLYYESDAVIDRIADALVRRT